MYMYRIYRCGVFFIQTDMGDRNLKFQQKIFVPK